MNSDVAALLAAHDSELRTLCRRFSVARLELFGSAAGDEWQPAVSDLDFVVSFLASAQPGLADRYLSLADGLEAALRRPVDLVTEDSIRNPYFRLTVNATRYPIYAHRDAQAAA